MPRHQLTGARNSLRGSTPGFGCSTERFQVTDYYQLDTAEPIMTTPMFGRLSVDWKDKYLFAEDRPQTGTFSRRGSASFVPAHPKKSATHFTRNHAWFGSIQIPSEDHELRVRELQRLAQRKVNDAPGPFESNLYTPAMSQRASSTKRYVPQGRKQQYVAEGDQRTHLVEVEKHVFREVCAGTSFAKAERLGDTRDFRGDGAGPAPGHYEAGRHTPWRPLDRVGNRSKSGGGHARGVTESRKGQYAHLATGRDNSSPVPRVRAPSLAYAMKQGHDWRALLQLQRPTGSPAYVGPHVLHGTSTASTPSAAPGPRGELRRAAREHMLHTLLGVPREPPSAAVTQLPDSVLGAYARAATAPTPRSREVDFHRSTYRAISPGPHPNTSAPSPSRSPPPRARAEPSAAARRELEEEGAFEPLDEEVHATMMEAGAQQRDEAGGGHTPPRSPTPKGGSRASTLASAHTPLVTPKMQRDMERAYHARHAVEASVEKRNEWKLRNLVGPA